MDELERVIAADKAGFKYVWVTEHHFLDEYSHLSANDVICGYLAHATERIHIGSGIFNPLPQVNHPAKLAERVAMLDHLSDGRFEFGTGRGAGSHEILGFLHPRASPTRPTPGRSGRTSSREFPKMWMQDTYEGYEGKFWSLPPRKILPKPYKKPHPPMWYAAGNTTSYEMAAPQGPRRARLLGRRARRGRAGASRPTRRRSRNAEPDRRVRQRQPHGHDRGLRGGGHRRRPRRSFVDARPNYLESNVFRYHDTFPHPPEDPALARAASPTSTPTRSMRTSETGQSSSAIPTRRSRSAGAGRPTGADQLVFGIGPAPPRGDARDDPAHGRARDPEDRHRPGAPHDQAP